MKNYKSYPVKIGCYKCHKITKYHFYEHEMDVIVNTSCPSCGFDNMVLVDWDEVKSRPKNK